MDTKWMTYQELADALRIEPASAKRLAIRRKWPKRPGNDGRARVGVPFDAFPERAAGDDTGGAGGDEVLRSAVRTGDIASDGTGAVTAAVTALSSHIKRLETELEAIKQERNAALARVVDRDAIAAQVDALRSVLDVERKVTEEVRQRADEAQARTDEVKAERDRWFGAAEAAQARIAELTAKAAELEARRGWWLFRRRA